MNRIILKNEHICFYCGKKEKCKKDLVYPVSYKGSFEVFSCEHCIQLKSGNTPEDFVDAVYKKGEIPPEQKEIIKERVLVLLKYMFKRNYK